MSTPDLIYVLYACMIRAYIIKSGTHLISMENICQSWFVPNTRIQYVYITGVVSNIRYALYPLKNHVWTEYITMTMHTTIPSTCLPSFLCKSPLNEFLGCPRLQWRGVWRWVEEGPGGGLYVQAWTLVSDFDRLCYL